MTKHSRKRSYVKAALAVTATAVAGTLATDSKTRRGYRNALALNLVLNAGWSYTFFKAQRLGPAVAVAAALAASSSDLARRARDVEPAAGAALAPYAAWTTFATALTTSIWKRNRGDH